MMVQIQSAGTWFPYQQFIMWFIADIWNYMYKFTYNKNIQWSTGTI